MEPLKDPLDDRVLKELTPPPHAPLSEELLYPYKDTASPSKQTKTPATTTKQEKTANCPDWQALRDHM